MDKQQAIKAGVLGLGTVGSGVMKLLDGEPFACAVEVKKVLVRDLDKPRGYQAPPELLTQDPWEILDDPEIGILIEVMGGEAALSYVEAALKSGKHVITANKDLIALHGSYLQELADQQGVELHYEAAVGGAIPIIRVLKHSFAADQISEVKGIVNGTTNYILSKMTDLGASFSEVLKEAQELGYAEADPYADVSGLDAARKMAILATLAFGRPIALQDVQMQGIEHLTQEDIEQAKQQNCTIKLIGHAKRSGDDIQVSVAPAVLPNTHPLAGVSDVFNAVYVYGAALGEAMLYGYGAGEMPTASAVAADLLHVLKGSKRQLLAEEVY